MFFLFPKIKLFLWDSSINSLFDYAGIVGATSMSNQRTGSTNSKTQYLVHSTCMPNNAIYSRYSKQ